DRSHFRSILREKTEGGVDIFRREEVDRIFLSPKLQLVEVEERNYLKGFHLGPAEPGISIALDDHDLILANSDSFDLVINDQEQIEEDEAQRDKKQRD